MNFDSIAVEMKLDGTNWTDVSGDVIPPITVSYGILGNSPTDRVAPSGSMRFKMNNSISNSGALAGYYTPGSTDCRDGFNIGLYCRIAFTKDSVTRYKFYGRIPPKGIIPIAGENGQRTTEVSVVNWLEYAANHEMTAPEFAQNKNYGEIVTLIVADVGTDPLATDYADGEIDYATAFDTVRGKTKALSEFQKLALSEYGYIYVRGDATGGETLVAEDRYFRPDIGSAEVMVVPGETTDRYLLTEAGGYLLQETGDKLILEEYDAVTAAYTGADIIGMVAGTGENLYNDIRNTSYPRKVDTDLVVLYELQKGFALASGETKTVEGRFRDPAGGTNNVSGINMVTPVAGTDYKFTTTPDGLGGDMTTDLNVTATIGTNKVTWVLENDGSSSGYVYPLQIRGYGVYTYDPTESLQSDSDSIADYGQQILTLDQKYLDNPMDSEGLTTWLLAKHKDAATYASWVRFAANRDHKNLWSFMELEPGDRITLTENQTAVSGDYFINGVEFDVSAAGIVTYKYHVVTADYTDIDVFTLGVDALDGDAVLGY